MILGPVTKLDKRNTTTSKKKIKTKNKKKKKKKKIDDDILPANYGVIVIFLIYG